MRGQTNDIRTSNKFNSFCFYNNRLHILYNRNVNGTTLRKKTLGIRTETERKV